MHTRMRLGELLLASGLLSADQLEAALQGQRSSGMKLGEYLIKQGICRESDVVDAVCRQTGIERYTPSRFPLNLSLSDRLPADVAQRTNAVPPAHPRGCAGRGDDGPAGYRRAGPH